MTTYEFFAYAGAAIAACAYIPLCKMVWKKEDGGDQSFATYFFWGVLDSIAAISAAQEHGNWILPATYVILAGAVCYCILHTGTFKWGWVESFTGFLVLICMIVWQVSGNEAAVIASTMAVCLATIPLAWEAWKEPVTAPLKTYSAFVVANGISIFSGHDWSVKERFYSTSCTFLTAAVVLLIYFRRRQVQVRQPNMNMADGWH